MDPSLVKQALEAIEKGDAKAALDILKGLVASAAGAEPEPDGDEDGSEGDGAEGVAPPAEAEKVEDPKVVDSAYDAKDGDAAKDDGDGDDDEDEDKPAKKAERKAMRAMLRSLTGAKSFGEALVKVEEFRASHLTLETERQKLAKERETLESAERRKLCVELIRLGAEFPATVWADDKATSLKSRWLKMPIAELRSSVSEQKKARGVKALSTQSVQPAKSGGSDVHGLSAEELAICEQMKCDPKDFAALKSFRDSKKG